MSDLTGVRPTFEPASFNAEKDPRSLGEMWVPLISCGIDIPVELFQVALDQLIHHPEHNSTLILRSDVISESSSDFPELVPRLEGLKPLKCIHRKLLARRPGRDASLEQYCTMYGAEEHPNTLVLTPIIPPDGALPYYHPRVHHIAFRLLPSDVLRIELVPLPETPLDPNSRLYRTSLALLDALHRYCWGAVTNYQKRVKHDVVVEREAYQDLYLVMRERHRHWVDEWKEATDPLKHVFEDIGIATFLILLWKGMYTEQTPIGEGEESWKRWPRPPGGFVDLGCGNALLTHILLSEGYSGTGIDVRARTTWDAYPPTTRSHLTVGAINPTNPDKSSLPAGAFLIGNHADELTPWIPVLSTLYGASGYLSIPCCPWALDGRYERGMDLWEEQDVATLNLPPGPLTSSYSSYRIWLASLSAHCGWEVECEVLRIPSTRNWAIVGRTRVGANADAERNVEMLLRHVRERGIFKTRKQEGKAGGCDH